MPEKQPKTNTKEADILKKSFLDAVKDGIGFDEWLKRDINLLSSLNIAKEQEITQKNGKKKNKTVFKDELRRLFFFASRLYYAKKRYDSQMESLGGYFRYKAVIDDHASEIHKKFHNIVLPKNDPFWDKFYPPNGLECECQVQVLTEFEMRREGYRALQNSNDLDTTGLAQSKFFARNFGKIGLKSELIAPFIKDCKLSE